MDAWKLNTGAGDQAFDRGDAAQRVVAWLHRGENFVHFMGFKYRHMDDFKGGLAKKKDWGLNKDI